MRNDVPVSAERISDEAYDPADERAHERPYIWTAAAIEAELETGRREESEQAATASLVVRVARITAGSIVALLGLILIPLPGPGFVVLGAGLSILAIDVPFARRLLKAVRARMPQDADGGTPNWLWLAMGGGVAVGLASSAAVLLT
jgi:hypothetical protein